MENATTALYIAAGTLLGVMIISLVVFVFRRVGNMYEEQDKVMTAQQLAEWNNEYLAYDKKIMYGTDLISVLNKAYSNNQKYVKGQGFLSGYQYSEEYYVDIEFKIKTALQDEVTVTYIDDVGDNGRIRGRENNYPVTIGSVETLGPTDTKLFETFRSNYNTIVEAYKNNTYGLNNTLNENTPLVTKAYDSTFVANSSYSLLDSNHNMNPVVEKMMKLSNNLTMTVTNRDKNKISIYQDVNTTHYGWYKATWKTCLSDLKSRKFKCSEVIYDTSSADTGRIVKMRFEEL